MGIHVKSKVYCLAKETARNTSFRLPSLPHTSEAFRLYVLCASLWKAALSPHPPYLNPISHGWLADNSNETLVPVPLPSDALAAPKEILTLMCCNYASDEPCVKKKCSRSKSEIFCTIFCKCVVSSP